MGTTREIGAHYIWLPGHPLLKNGHVLWRENEEPLVVETTGVTREREGLEFYGGMIVADFVREALLDWQPGDSLLERIAGVYLLPGRGVTRGLALVQGADWKGFSWTRRTIITKIR
ncbi:MAG: hypothetical protein LBP56_09235 [Odoribacteraceae bacterium]|jgi:hypothetical protein|nr:hypothetical protein [Odoribacteraceae bacterium]